ncbi:MAG: DUF4340 domain-containing protein [Verrucomicrobiota bacterium]
MQPKHTWLWLLVAVGLFAGIFLHHRYSPRPERGPFKLLPGFSAAAVTSVEILPANQRAIHAEKSGKAWRLTEPIQFPARNPAIAQLLARLEEIVPHTRVSSEEIGNMRDANEKFGFNPPPFTIVLQPGDQHIQLGNKNGPGDSVFVKVVGRDGLSVVDAELLRLIPRSMDDWREDMLTDFARLEFDQLYVTNGAKVLELERNLTNGLWRLVLPMAARADRTKIIDSLQKLQNVRTSQFVDQPKLDWDSYGLQTPDLSLAFKSGTNLSLLLAFGRSPTNDATRVYARRNDENTVMLVSKELIEPWHAAHETFRDRHLVTPSGPLSAIEFHGLEQFALRRTNSQWLVAPQNYAADTALVTALITNLGALQVAQFYKDVVVAPDLPALGLAEPAYRLIFKAHSTNAAGVVTDVPVGEIDFGTNQNDLIFAQRTDEPFVYAVHLEDFQRLPMSALQLRDRTVWSFSTNDVARLTVRHGGKTRALLRRDNGDWKFAPGTQGIMDEVTSQAIEETVYRFGCLEAEAWAGRGEENRSLYGFQPEGMHVSIELKSGRVLDVEFGGQASLGSPFAQVNLNGEVWTFEFPPMLYQLVQSFLAIRPEAL